MDLNKVMLIGRLTRDPELRTIPSGQSVATFSLATGRVWKDQQGARQEKTEFHNIVVWRKLAEIAGQYLKKGRQIYLEGRLENRSWDDPSGVKKYRTEIVADNLIMLGSKSDNAAHAAASQSPSVSVPTAKDFATPSENISAPIAPESMKKDEEEIRVEDIPF